MKKITIAIDGHSSTGKSTVAKQLAEHLGYIYVDSGAMYRAITFYAMQNGFITAEGINKMKLINHLGTIDLRFIYHTNSNTSEVFLNGKNVEKEIRTMEVSNNVSRVAEIPEVRKKLVEIQQQMGRSKGVVMDGRDIGTVVFPDAELKIFLTASAEERARRRFMEHQTKGETVTYESVLENVQNRDYIDSTRNDSPLIITKDAIVIDNTHTTKEDQFHIILQLAKDRIAGRV